MRYSLLCDCDWEVCIEAFDGADDKVGDSRRNAAKQGWTYRIIPRTSTAPMRSLDLCPKHSTPPP